MRRILRIAGGVFAVLVVLLLAAVIYVQVAWDRPEVRGVPVMTAPRDSATVARGEHIFRDTWQCSGCHSTDQAVGNPSPSGGRVFDLRGAGPGFGIFYSRNITPDSATGIGAWTDGEIVQAIREGLGRDRHMLFPLMPVDWLRGLSDQDALAIVAYLRTIKPVTYRVPDDDVSFFARGLMAFHVLKPQDAITAPVSSPAPGATLDYGRYFATSLAGCAECHSSRNLRIGRFYEDSLFTGSSFAYGDDGKDPLVSFAPDIRPANRDGIGSWTAADFAEAVTTGMRPDSTVLDPHMPYPGYKFLTEDEVRGVYLFLRTLEPLSRTVPAPQYAAGVREARGAARGKMLFEARCQSCHGVEGLGARATSVRLSEVASSMGDPDLKEFVASGQLNLKMPAFRKTLSSEELDDIVAYVRTWKGH